MTCKRCKERGKNWNGDDPECGFDENGNFQADNWNCATLNALRDEEKFWEEIKYNPNDQRLLTHTVEDEPYIVLSWYKSRGKCEGAWEVDQTEMKPLTLKLAEMFLDSEGL